MTKRIDPEHLKAQLDFLAAPAPEKKSSPAKKSRALKSAKPVPHRVRIRRLIEMEDGVEKARALNPVKPLETPAAVEHAYVGPGGERFEVLPAAKFSNEKTYTPRGKVEEAQAEAKRDEYDEVLAKLEAVMQRAPRYTWRDAERDLREWYAAHPGVFVTAPKSAEQWKEAIRDRMTNEVGESLSAAILVGAVDKIEDFEVKKVGERLFRRAAKHATRGGLPDFRFAITRDARVKLEEYAAKLIARFAERLAVAGGAQ